MPPDLPSPSCPAAPKANFRVVITLTGSGARWLVEQAEQRGWQVAHWPGLTFQFTGRADELTTLSAYDWLILTSPQGVRSLQSGLKELGSDMEALQGIRVAAVGEGTAQPLRDWGRQPDFLPTRADAPTLAAELPAQPGERVLHVTGEDARETLGEGLQSRGILYRQLALYRSEAKRFEDTARADLRQADWVVIASGVVAQGLAAQLGPHVPLLAMGQQTAQAAREAGFTQVRCAATPSLEGLLKALDHLQLGGEQE